MKNSSSDPDFERFWESYPHRVAKLAAMRAFVKAKKRASLIEILAGVLRYRQHKPAYAEWAHPATWLNAGRWMDEYEGTKPRDRWACPHVDRCSNREQCGHATILGRPVKVRA